MVTDNKKQSKVTIPFFGWTYVDDPAKVATDLLREFVKDILDDEYLQNATEVLKALRSGKEDRAFGALAAILKEGESLPRLRGDSGFADLGKGKWRARLRAVEVLAELGHPDVAERLDAAVRNDPDGIVRMEALRALFNLSPIQARKNSDPFAERRGALDSHFGCRPSGSGHRSRGYTCPSPCHDGRRAERGPAQCCPSAGENRDRTCCFCPKPLKNSYLAENVLSRQYGTFRRHHIRPCFCHRKLMAWMSCITTSSDPIELIA